MSSRHTEVEQQFSSPANRSIFEVVTLPLALVCAAVSLSVYVCGQAKADQGECIMCVCLCVLSLGSMRPSVCLAPEQRPLDPVGRTYSFPKHTHGRASVNSNTECV